MDAKAKSYIDFMLTYNSLSPTLAMVAMHVVAL